MRAWCLLRLQRFGEAKAVLQQAQSTTRASARLTYLEFRMNILQKDEDLGEIERDCACACACACAYVCMCASVFGESLLTWLLFATVACSRVLSSTSAAAAD